jgi:hypothetical protein
MPPTLVGVEPRFVWEGVSNLGGTSLAEADRELRTASAGDAAREAPRSGTFVVSRDVLRFTVEDNLPAGVTVAPSLHGEGGRSAPPGRAAKGPDFVPEDHDDLTAASITQTLHQIAPSPETRRAPSRLTLLRLLARNLLASGQASTSGDREAAQRLSAARTLLPLLVSARPGIRGQLAVAVRRLSDPLSVVAAAFEHYNQTAKEAYLQHARSLLEAWGAKSWPALRRFARCPRPEVELFTGLIARCAGVSDKERLDVLERLAHHPVASVRLSIFERLGEFPPGMVEPLLQKLLQHPDLEVRSEATDRLEYLA